MHANEMQIGECGEEGAPVSGLWSGLSVKDDK